MEETLGAVNGLRSHMSGPRGWPPEGMSVYQHLAQHMQDISGDRGVLKEVIRSGSGETVPCDATVIVRYSGYLEHADKPFDTNCYRRYPRLMKLGADITLFGMEVGLLTMQRGELSRFLFSPKYAFGTLGCPPLIPPSATLLFEIELLDFLDTAESDSFCNLTQEQQSTFPLDTVLKIANTEREFGNYLFKRNRYEDAKDRYKRPKFTSGKTRRTIRMKHQAYLVLARLPSCDEDRRPLDAARLFVNLNLSITYLKLERPPRALKWGEKALAIDSKNTKALYRCGQAYLEMRDYEKAKEFLLAAQKMEPFNLEINSELKRLASCYEDYKAEQRLMCYRMFAQQSSAATSG